MLYLIVGLSSYDCLCFEVCFVRFKYCYPSFLLTSICMISVFPSPYFQFAGGFKNESLTGHINGSCIFVYSMTLYLLIGAFTPFTFRVISIRYVFIAVLLLDLCLFSTSPQTLSSVALYSHDFLTFFTGVLGFLSFHF